MNDNSTMLQKIKDNAFYIALGVGILAIIALIAVYTMRRDGQTDEVNDIDLNQASDYSSIESDENYPDTTAHDVQKDVRISDRSKKSSRDTTNSTTKKDNNSGNTQDISNNRTPGNEADGTTGSAAGGAAGSETDGTPGSASNGAAGSASGGTATSATEGTQGGATDSAPGSASNSAAGSASGGTATSATEGTQEGTTDTTPGKGSDIAMEDGEKLPVTADAGELNFGSDKTLSWPIKGEVILPFSMETTVYYKTLDQYRTNPGILIAAGAGSTVKNAYLGKVVKVTSDNTYGNLVTLYLGNDYSVVYGQLDTIYVKEGDFVKAGESVGTIGKPSDSFEEEGSHLFFKLLKGDTPVDPVTMME